MALATENQVVEWTAIDLVERFGPIPLSRVRFNPAPGTATEDDVVALDDHQDRLCELVEGILVEKTVGTYESWVAGILFRLLGNFAADRGLGITLPADGMLRLAPGLVRIPDVCFISKDRLPGGRMPRDPIAELVPDLAVEVISRGNTKQEMDRKLRDYFEAGVRLVWYVYPNNRQVHVYRQIDNCQIIGEEGDLDGGDVVPGLTLPVRQIFAEPTQ